MSAIIVEIIAILLLLVASGIFAMTEIAIVSYAVDEPGLCSVGLIVMNCSGEALDLGHRRWLAPTPDHA